MKTLVEIGCGVVRMMIGKTPIQVWTNGLRPQKTCHYSRMWNELEMYRRIILPDKHHLRGSEVTHKSLEK